VEEKVRINMLEAFSKHAHIPCNTVSLLHVFTFLKSIVLKRKTIAHWAYMLKKVTKGFLEGVWYFTK